ncbi:MAG: NAD(P)H dehydrogenase assembly family protein [Cyanobacteria bacterium J06638_7]
MAEAPRHHDSAPDPGPAPALTVGQSVCLSERPAYLKTADPMPMLRPADLIGPQEPGQVVELRALGLVAVRFRRGTFLLAATALAPA